MRQCGACPEPGTVMRRVCLLLLLIGLPACNSDETFDPVGPSGPTVPSIGGTFSSPNMFHFEVTDGRVFDCNGALTIGTQIATSFSGTFVIADQERCGGIGGTVTSGTFSTDGTISFALTSAGAETVFVACGLRLHVCERRSTDDRNNHRNRPASREPDDDQLLDRRPVGLRARRRVTVGAVDWPQLTQLHDKRSGTRRPTTATQVMLASSKPANRPLLFSQDD